MADCSTSKEPPKPISQRATRKAAAACLARQRHKVVLTPMSPQAVPACRPRSSVSPAGLPSPQSFVNTLQDAIEARKMRVGVLKKRKEDYFAAVAAHMIRGIRAQLSPAREAELQRWLQRPPPPSTPSPHSAPLRVASPYPPRSGGRGRGSATPTAALPSVQI